MQRTIRADTRILGAEVRIRIGSQTFEAIRKHLAQPNGRENFCFAIAERIRTTQGTMLLAREIFIPEKGDLAEQSWAGVSPSKEFQASVYKAASSYGTAVILDLHTHPHKGRPVFSGTDHRVGLENAHAIERIFEGRIQLAMVVFGNDVTAHDAVIYDGELRDFRELEAIEIVGRHTRVLPTRPPKHEGLSPKHDRQGRIPGWDQSALEHLRVFVAGAGGNGAQLLCLMMSMGVGRKGWIAVADPDTIEVSNLSRNPYATVDDIGESKVSCFQRYAERVEPGIRVIAIEDDAAGETARPYLAAATVLFGCVDRDGIRAQLNECAVRYQTPYIDLGCGVIIESGRIDAGGQVHTVLPGLNGCLACRGGYDASEAARDQMDEAARADYAAVGYVTGRDEEPTPSVVVLNIDTARHAISALLRLVAPGPFDNKHSSCRDAVFSDLIRERSMGVEAPADPDCPLCGPGGYLAAGDREEPPYSVVDTPVPGAASGDSKLLPAGVHETRTKPPSREQKRTQPESRVSRLFKRLLPWRRNGQSHRKPGQPPTEELTGRDAESHPTAAGTKPSPSDARQR